MNKQKGLAPILIVLLIALGIGGYLIYQKQIKPASQQTTQPTSAPSSIVDTTNWRTYIGIDFSFKYPVLYKLKETVASQTTLKGISLEKNTTYQSGGFAGGDVLKTGSVIAFTIIPRKDLSEAVLKDEYGNQISVQKKMLGQKERIEVIFPKQGNNSPRHIFYTLSSNVLDISLGVGLETTSDQYSSYISDFDQILSTFKFTQ